MSKVSRYEPRVKDTYADFAEYYQTVVLPNFCHEEFIISNQLRLEYGSVTVPESVQGLVLWRELCYQDIYLLNVAYFITLNSI